MKHNMFSAILVIALLVTVLGSSQALAETIHVAKTGSDLTGNGSVDDPYATIQKGIGMASAGDTVLVAAGTYVENIRFFGKAITVTSTHPGSPAVVAATIIDGDAINSVVIFQDGEGNDTVITGFTIQNGYAVIGSGLGGGIYCYNYSSPTIRGNVITGNTADIWGGGIFCYWYSTAVIEGNTITGNHNGDHGGQGPGIMVGHYSTPTIEGNTITGNYGGPGGGIYCYDHASPTITNNTISGNDGTLGGGIMCDWESSPTIAGNTITGNVDGGGIFCNMDSSPTITDNTISDNAGEGIWCHESSATITGNTITGNYAQFTGGGIHCTKSDPMIAYNTITGNAAEGSGGGVFCTRDASPTIAYNTISGNIAGGNGGGIACHEDASPMITGNAITGNIASADGGGIDCENQSSPTIKGNTISGNIAGGGGGGIHCTWHSSPTITDSIVWGNAATVGPQIAIDDHESSLSVSYCDVEGGEAAVYLDSGGTVTWGSGNIDADPLLAALGYWDDNGTPADADDDFWVDGDYHLKSTVGRWDPAADAGAGAWVADGAHSPCIDTGDGASVFVDEPAPNGGRVNMGAYGNTVEASLSNARGTVQVATDPDTGTWTLTGPAGYVHNGTGDETVTEVPAAMCTVSWHTLTGYDLPANSPETKEVLQDQTTTFTGVYAAVGAVAVSTSPADGTWTLTGPDAYSYSGTGDETVAGVPPGSYTVTWHSLANHDLPPNSPETKEVLQGQTTTFTGNYELVFTLSLSVTGITWSDEGRTAAISYKANEPVKGSYYYRLYQTQPAYNRTSSTAVTFDNLEDGYYLFVVTARDELGRFASAPCRVWFINKTWGEEFQVYLASYAVYANMAWLTYAATEPCSVYYVRLHDAEDGYTRTTSTTTCCRNVSDGIHYFVVTGKEKATGNFPPSPARQFFYMDAEGP